MDVLEYIGNVYTHASMYDDDLRPYWVRNILVKDLLKSIEKPKATLRSVLTHDTTKLSSNSAVTRDTVLKSIKKYQGKIIIPQESDISDKLPDWAHAEWCMQFESLIRESEYETDALSSF